MLIEMATFQTPALLNFSLKKGRCYILFRQILLWRLVGQIISLRRCTLALRFVRRDAAHGQNQHCHRRLSVPPVRQTEQVWDRAHHLLRPSGWRVRAHEVCVACSCRGVCCAVGVTARLWCGGGITTGCVVVVVGWLVGCPWSVHSVCMCVHIFVARR